MRVLLLGGTSEARELAAELVATGVQVTSSLAGRVAKPRLPVGRVRVGGFGGVDGLRATLVGFDVVIDATHPFAVGMSTNAAVACAAENRPLLRLERPPWPIDEAWHDVGTHTEAAHLAATLGSRPFITVGRQELATFVAPLAHCHATARVVDTPDVTIPARWQLITSRGPYTLAGELDVMSEHLTDVLITKNSGGTYTWPKLAAAEQLGVAVVMIRRPQEQTSAVHTVADALSWLRSQS